MCTLAEVAAYVSAAQHDEILEALGSRQLPRYVDTSGVAQMLETTPSMISKLRGEGMPYVRLGEVYRYDVASVQQWLASRGGAQ